MYFQHRKDKKRASDTENGIYSIKTLVQEKGKLDLHQSILEKEQKLKDGIDNTAYEADKK